MSKKTKTHEASVFGRTEPEQTVIAPDTATEAAQDAPAGDADQTTNPTPAPGTGELVATDAAKRGRKGKAATPAEGADTGLTMAGLAARYTEGLRLAGKGLGTQFSYSIDLQVAVRHFGPETAVASLTPRKVQIFFDCDAVTKTRAGKAKAQPTIDKTRRVLRLALEWAASQGLIPAAPLPEKPAKTEAA